MDFNIGDIAIGMGLGIALCVIVFNWMVERIGAQVWAKLEQEQANNIGMRVEVDQNIIYCYNSETNQFLCQGRTLTEISEAFQARFPHLSAYVNDGDPKVIAQWKKEINETGNHIRSAS
jgi:hypothetical protein